MLLRLPFNYYGELDINVEDDARYERWCAPEA